MAPWTFTSVGFFSMAIFSAPNYEYRKHDTDSRPRDSAINVKTHQGWLQRGPDSLRSQKKFQIFHL